MDGSPRRRRRPGRGGPLTRITSDIDAAVRDEMKGQPRQTVEAAARRAVGDAVFLFSLVFRTNGAALEIAGRQSLIAIALFFWMGMALANLLAGDAESPDGDPQAGEVFGTSTQWRTVFEAVMAVEAEDEARASLERQYLGGHPVLFSDAAKEWAAMRHLVEEVAELAALLPTLSHSRADRGASRRFQRSVGAYAAERMAALADDARVTAFELLDERPRAAAIMERRLREGLDV